MRDPVYDHVSLLAPYTATIDDETGHHELPGLGTVEYARCMTPQSLSARPLPKSFKLPVGFFTYQIIDLDADRHVLLTDVQVLGATVCRLAHVRTRTSSATVYDDVVFEVTEWAPDPKVDRLGRTMRVPHTMQWTVRDQRGADVLILDALVEAPFRPGHGRGYVSAFRYEGTWQSQKIKGSGYLEWVDCRARVNRLCPERPALSRLHRPRPSASPRHPRERARTLDREVSSAQPSRPVVGSSPIAPTIRPLSCTNSNSIMPAMMAPQSQGVRGRPRHPRWRGTVSSCHGSTGSLPTPRSATASPRCVDCATRSPSCSSSSPPA